MENDPNNYRKTHLLPKKDELLHQIEQEWTKLMHVIQHLDEDEMSTPDTGGWSIKDNLAHIFSWERYLCEHHIRKSPPHEVLGMDSDSYKKADEDGINNFLFRQNKDLTLTQILTELHHTHEVMLSDLEELPISELMKPHYAGNPDARPLLWWVIANTSDHYKEHRHSIERFIRDVKK